MDKAEIVELTKAVAGLGDAVTHLEEAVTADPSLSPFILKYAAGHPKEADGVPSPLVGPYAMAFDTATMTVQDHHQFHKDTPLLVVKAVFHNVLNGFSADYRNQVLQLFLASQNIAKRIQGGKPPIPEGMVDEALGRATMAAERARERLMMWDGKGEFNVLLPYCIVVEQGEEGARIIDFQKSRLSVSGMLWSLKFE